MFFFFLMIRLPPRSTRTDTLFPYTTLFRSFLDERACIAPFQVQLDNNAALAVLASYLVKSFGEPYLGHLCERDLSAHCARFFGQEDRQRADVVKVDAGCIRHAYRDV